MSSAKSTSPTLPPAARKRPAKAAKTTQKVGVATSARYAKSFAQSGTAHLGEHQMATKPATVTFHSSAFKHASDNALKKREFVREAVSHGRITTKDSRSEVKEDFRTGRARGKDE
jgi:hypothetical protein